MEQVILPTVRGMAAEGHPYTGFLYAGLMIDDDGNPSVIEFNCRFGDPETQPIMMRLASDLDRLCSSALAGELATTTAQWDSSPALGVVLAAEGYPGSYAKGEAIGGLDDLPESSSKMVFHAGTALDANGQVTAVGGRVLAVTGLGDTAEAARAKAYDAVAQIDWPEGFYRRDIANS